MSQLKKSMTSSLLKDKFTNLLEGLERTNTSKMIIERYYASLASLEIAEGKNTATSVLDELKGLGVEQSKARHMVQVAAISEKKSQIADQFLLKRIDILESAIKELKGYSWMESVGKFIKESEDFLRRNEVYILIERVIFDLEMDKNSSYFSKAINKLTECSKETNPVMAIVETMEDEKWIPLVKKLYEYASKLKGSTTGENPNFKVSKIYSPVVAIDEETFTFVSSGKVLEIKGSVISESDRQLDEATASLVRIAESAKFSSNGMRIYPNVNSVLDLEFGDTTTVKLNGKVVESTEIEKHLLAGGFIKYGESSKLSYISQAVSEGSKIKEIDFGYKVTSSVFEGLSASIFNIENKIYIQKVNKGMKENVIVEAQSAEDAVRMVKDFMNYDISNSLIHLLENEKAEATRREREIGKIESRIKFLIESLSDLERISKVQGVENSERIKKAKAILEGEISAQKDSLSKFGLVEGTDADGFKPTSKKDIITDYTVGQEYVIDGETGYTYQGVTDGVHIFNSDKGEKSPKTFTEEEIKSAKIEKA
jgi:hypothetical protein